MADGIQQPRKNISSLAIQGFDLITENPQLEPPNKARFTRSTNKKTFNLSQSIIIQTHQTVRSGSKQSEYQKTDPGHTYH